jgi:ComEC/Rec2-related protein
MKRPLVPVALAYASGLILASRLAQPLAWLFGIALLLALAALVSGRLRPVLLWPLLVLAGWVNLASRVAVLSPDDLRRIVGQEPALVIVRGRLIETPLVRVYTREGEASWRFLAVLQAEAVERRGTAWQPAYGRVAVTTAGPLPAHFFAGQRVEVSGLICLPSGPVAEGLFDYRQYLRWQGIYYQLRVRTANDWQAMPPVGPPPLADRFLRWARATLARGLPRDDSRPVAHGMPADSAPAESTALELLWSMALGWRTALTQEVSEPFMQTGTMHIFAISGLHVALIAGILVALLRVAQAPRFICGWLVVPLLWFYTAATGWQSSAIRSTIMMSVVIGGWMLRRPGELLNSLAASAFVILLWDPAQLFQASFQLSFFVVLSIALLLPPIEQKLSELLETDPFLPPELAPRWRRWSAAPLRLLARSFATSLAAWLGSLPLTAWYFHLLTPVSLLANLIIVPLSGLALMCNLGSLFCGNWLPGLTELFNHSAWFWMTTISHLCDWARQLPAAWFYVPAPTIGGMALYYALLVGLLSGWLTAPARRRWLAVAGGLLCVGGAALWLVGRQNVQITLLPLEGGAAHFIDAPGRGRDLLIDCGNAERAERVLKPFLGAQGVNRLSWVVFSHGDVRHVGGAELIQETFRPRRVATSAARFRSPAYRSALARLAGSPEQWVRLHPGDTVAGWRVLHPSETDAAPLADDKALVMRADFYGHRVLLLSDLGKTGQAALLARGEDLRADIVVTGLPRQSEPLADALLEAIHPRLIIVTDAPFPAAERAGKLLRERLAKQGVPVIYTSDTGAATLLLRPGRWLVRSATGEALVGTPTRRAPSQSMVPPNTSGSERQPERR